MLESDDTETYYGDYGGLGYTRFRIVSMAFGSGLFREFVLRRKETIYGYPDYVYREREDLWTDEEFEEIRGKRLANEMGI